MAMPVISSSHDFQGLARLRREAQQHDPAALEEAAVQFEALIVGIMLKSAREANLGDGLFDSDQSQQYLELMDQQVALDLARHGGFGFGKLLVDGVRQTWTGEQSLDSGLPDNSAGNLTPITTERVNPLDLDEKRFISQAGLESEWGTPQMKPSTGHSAYRVDTLA